MKFYLLREREFQDVFTGSVALDNDSPLKRGTRILLRRSAERERLAHGAPEYHRIISPIMRSFFQQIDSVEADCWIAAKKAFGYPLSPAQESALTKFRAKKILEQRQAA